MRADSGRFIDYFDAGYHVRLDSSRKFPVMTVDLLHGMVPLKRRSVFDPYQLIHLMNGRSLC